MKKFSTYADRNIFVANVNIQTAGISDPSKKSESTKEELSIIIDEVEALKEKYLTLRANHIKLTKECKEGDLLLKDMRKSLFTIRVGAQTLDECKVQPLIETVAILEQHQQTMTELTSKAKGSLSNCQNLDIFISPLSYHLHRMIIRELVKNIT